MPARGTVKHFEEDAFYHLYNRGIDGREIFIDDEDYRVFLSLLKRHLSREKEQNKRGEEYDSFAGRLELQSFCLMPTHYHLVIYLNNDVEAITELMRRVVGSYTMYFNKKYQRSGPLFQGVYRAAKIEDEQYLLYLTRYIHRNPEDYYGWQYSSLPYFIKDWKADWVVPDRVYKLYEWGTYETFLNDHEHHNQTTSEIHLNHPYLVQ